MVKRSKRNHQILFSALSLLKNNKKLLIFPFLGVSFFIAIIAIVLWPFAPYRNSLQPLTTAQLHQLLVPYIIFLIALSIAHFVLLFFNSALIASTQNYFHGKVISISEGLKTAFSIFWKLALWNTFASTVGIFIFLFPQSAKKVKWIEQRLATQNWNIASYFVTPFLLSGNKSPLNALAASSSLLQQTWGNHLIANFKFGWLLLLMRFIFLTPLLIGFLIGNKIALMFGGAITAISYFFISVVNTGIKTTLCSVLFFYASNKKIPANFREDDLKKSFLSKA